MSTMLHGKHLLTFDDWGNREIELVLSVAREFKREYALARYSEMLKQKTLFMIFFEQSTRTRNSMEAAMTQLGGHAHDLTPDKMQLSHGETAKDTAKVLSRIGEGIAIRNCFFNIGNKYLSEIAKHSEVPVISMQDDVYHPLQAIADLMTIQEYFGDSLRGLKVAITWAYATSHAKPLSVPHSQLLLFPRFGIDVAIAHPAEFPLDKQIVAKAEKNAQSAGAKITFHDNMPDAVKDADIVIPKNWGGFAYFDKFDESEHFTAMKANLEKHRDWFCDSKMFALAKKDAKVMHALPADRGNEVSDEVLDSENSIIYDEAENRLHTAKSLLALMLGGK